MALEFALIAFLLITVASGYLHHWRMAIVGLFSIATVLFIDTTNTFLNAQQLPQYQGGQWRNRLRTLIAGALMTATVNALIVLFAGWHDHSHTLAGTPVTTTTTKELGPTNA
jgi:hypothetical protein